MLREKTNIIVKVVQGCTIDNLLYRLYTAYRKRPSKIETVTKAIQVPYWPNKCTKGHNSYKHRSKGPKSGIWSILCRYKFIQVIQVITRRHRKVWITLVKVCEAKEKYRGLFEIQKSGDKTSSGEIGLDIRTHASPKVGQDQVSGGVKWNVTKVVRDL